MNITPLNGSRTFSLQLNQRELAIVISSIDYALAGVDVPALDPQPGFEQSIEEAGRMRVKLEGYLPSWRAVVG